MDPTRYDYFLFPFACAASNEATQLRQAAQTVNPNLSMRWRDPRPREDTGEESLLGRMSRSNLNGPFFPVRLHNTYLVSHSCVRNGKFLDLQKPNPQLPK